MVDLTAHGKIQIGRILEGSRCRSLEKVGERCGPGQEAGKEAPPRTWEPRKDSGLCSESHEKPVKGWKQLSKTQICIFLNYLMKS